LKLARAIVVISTAISASARIYKSDLSEVGKAIIVSNAPTGDIHMAVGTFDDTLGRVGVIAIPRYGPTDSCHPSTAAITLSIICEHYLDFVSCRVDFD
jgi:hypothetical protein